MMFTVSIVEDVNDEHCHRHSTRITFDEDKASGGRQNEGGGRQKFFVVGPEKRRDP